MSAASNKIKLEEINRKSYGDDFQDDGLDVSSGDDEDNISNSEARSPSKKLRQRVGKDGVTRGGTLLMESGVNKKRESVITPRSSLR